MSFLSEYGIVIAFYIGVILLIYLNRSKFEFQGKIIAMYRNNWGVDWMNKTGKKHAKVFRVLGDIGIYVGYAGMALIMVMIVKGFWDIFTNPLAPPTVSPVLPGVPIAGTGLTVPLIEGIIALFLVIVVHESAHGLVAAANGMKVKSSGLVLLGPIPGAFVEPDEKKLDKVSVRKQLAVFAAGPWSNVIQAFVFMGLFLATSLLITSFIQPVGFTVDHLTPNGPAAQANMLVDEPIIMVEGQTIEGTNYLLAVLANKTPGDSIALSSPSATYDITLGEHPLNASNSYIGINGLDQAYDIQITHPIIYFILRFILNIFQWTYILALGLGLANLLPLGPVDGGRMYRHLVHKLFGEKTGDVVWAKTAMILLVVLVVLLIVPIVRAVFRA